MKTIIFLYCFLVFNLASFSQSNADLGVAAIGLVVSDIEISENFYKNILGMKEAGGFSLDEQWSNEAGAANGKPFSVRQFKMKDLSCATVLKLAYFDKIEKQADVNGINSNSGVNYITLFYSAQDFKEVMERISESGIEKVGWVKRESYQLVFIKDPDGIFVEIVGPPDK
ncbi:VOC family protein [Aestuariivivens sediminis]|uniref:VOC family protein n=1 Tax=Aestuariivivens sediminis TaxID=2913557 RepID=UPI001F5A6214|nr:VOC family protein [Aestuariivivens sediminis]